MSFANLDELRSLCLDLPGGDEQAASMALSHQNSLTKPPGSLGRLEELVVWMARWQGRAQPVLDNVQLIIFAGSHGITAQNVSAYGAEVTAQMVANFAAGGAAINQLALEAGAQLKVVPLSIEQPTQDFTRTAAMSEAEFVEAVKVGFDAVDPQADVLALGEMGIGNTTVAAAICLALFGGSGQDWVGRGTGVDDEGVARKIDVIEKAIKFHKKQLDDPLKLFQLLGGRELAALFGASLCARINNIPVLLDGFVVSAAVAPFYKLNPASLDHVVAGHVSKENAHRILLAKLDLRPLLDLEMRLGEGSGAALAIQLCRAALACHNGMATFAQAGVDGDTA